jgi:calcium permeable stress-gated cation channel
MGACILAIVFASTFALIFPLIAPAVVLFLLLTLIGKAFLQRYQTLSAHSCALPAHRYLVGYVYVRTHSQTGGVLQLWLLKRFGSLLSFQPILMGLIFLSRKLWIEGGILVGVGVFVVLFVESYCAWKTRLPGYKTLNATTRQSVEQFASGADTYLDPDRMVTPANPSRTDMVENDANGVRSSVVRSEGMRTLGSFASVLDLMSRTLAVAPSSSAYRGAVPLGALRFCRHERDSI